MKKNETVGNWFMRLAACALTIMLASGSVWGKSFSLDLRQREENTQRRRLLKASNKGNDGTLRSFDLDAGAADVGDVAVGDELEFTLFDDVALTLTLKEAMPSPLGGDVFLAEVSGYEGIKTAVVLRTADGLTIDVQDFLHNKVYKVISTPTGVIVSEIEPSHEGKCGCDALEPPTFESSLSYDAVTSEEGYSVSGRAEPRLLASAAEQSDTCVDILVAYDKNAASYANSNGGGITNFAQVAVQKMNAALANTGLDTSFRFRLVGVTKVAVSANDVHDALYAIRDGETGWSDIKTVRETVGADIVTTMIDTGSALGTTGVGWSLSSTSSLSSFASSAYNVCAIRAVTQSDTMTHECGHNMGAGHSDVQDTQPGPQLYDYSAGYYFTAGGRAYSTIMAYGHENPSGANTTEVPYFSSPSYTYEGVAVGNAKHDNTRTLANTFSYATNWRAQKVPKSYDVVFEPASGTLIDGSLAVTLTPGKSGVEIRYTLDGSEPTAFSPRYTGPITITGRTTIKAVTVVGGVCSLPCSATYYSRSDLGYALGLPVLEWTTTDNYPWVVDTEHSIDGLSVKGEVGIGSNAVMSVSITGPATMTFNWLRDSAFGYFRVYCDSEMLYNLQSAGYGSAWTLQTLEIPAGKHDISFHVYCSSARGERTAAKYWLDDMRIFYTPKPVFEPATTTASDTACTFTGDMMVSLAAQGDDTKIYYTLDGSDPDGEDATLYDGPFFITKSTRVKAIAVQPGMGSSAVAEGHYIERHRPKPGEWTRNGDGAFEAVEEDGRMICVMQWNYPGCVYSSVFYSIAGNEDFKEWAAINGIYLVAVDYYDAYEEPGTESPSRHFSPLWSQTGLSVASFPQLVLASASDTSKALGGFWGYDYRTVPGLIEKFASYLDEAKPLGAPVASVTDAYGRSFPFSVTLSNTNSTGTIYYTLDGSAPTRTNGIRYTGAFTIPSAGTTLKAVVWPDGADAVSGVPLIIKYASLEDRLGVYGLTLQNDDKNSWYISPDYSTPTLTAKKDASFPDVGTTTLKGRVRTKGVLSFGYSGHFSYNVSALKMKVDGIEVFVSDYDNSSGQFSYAVDSEDGVEIEWTYSYYAPWETQSTYWGCWISNLKWEPASPPAAPDGLTASDCEYAYGTLLRWTESTNAKSYEIYRNTANNASGATLVGTAEKCWFWDTTGDMGRQYWYWVKAVNKYGASGFSAGASGRRPVVYSIAYNANGGTGDMAGQSCIAGESLTVMSNSFIRIDHMFRGWATTPNGPVEYNPDDPIVMTSNLTLYAVWEYSPFAFGGDASWTEQEDDSWKSGTIVDSQSTWISKTVYGKGTLTFEWKVSSERNYDKLYFYEGTTSITNISGTVDWQKITRKVTTDGLHEFKWKYSKDGSVSTGSDCGWIRDVVWSPDSIMEDVGAGAAPEVVDAAVDRVGFADDGVKALIGGSAEEYGNFKSWMQTIGDEAAVVASEHAAVAYLLGATTLFQNEPTITISEVEVGKAEGDGADEGASITLSVTVMDGEDAVAVAEENVRAMFEATSDLGDWNGAAKLAPTIEILEGEGNTLRFKVTPGDGKATRAFLRIRK